MTEWLGRVGELPTALLIATLGVVMVLDAIPLLGVLVPGDVAILATMGVGGPARDASTLVGVIGGCLAGWSLVFFAGRLFGERIRRGRLGRWIGEPRWAAVEQVLVHGGGRMVVAAPFLPVLNALIPLAAGGLRMSYRRFLGNAAVGAALWGGLYVGLGMSAGVVGEVLPGDSFTTVATVAIGLAFGWLALLGARRRLALPPAGGLGQHPVQPGEGLLPHLRGEDVAEAGPVLRGRAGVRGTRAPNRPHLVVRCGHSRVAVEAPGDGSGAGRDTTARRLMSTGTTGRGLTYIDGSHSVHG